MSPAGSDAARSSNQPAESDLRAISWQINHGMLFLLRLTTHLPRRLLARNAPTLPLLDQYIACSVQLLLTMRLLIILDYAGLISVFGICCLLI